MKETSQKLQQQLQTVLDGYAWYGSNVYDIIAGVTFEAAYTRPPGGVHSIAEIVLHMLGWTEEVLSRMQGNPAGMPKGGDWPDAGTPDEEKWQRLKNDIKLMNLALADAIEKLPSNKWDAPTNDDRNRELGTGVTYEALINGLIQHHVYHAGQIAILVRMLG